MRDGVLMLLVMACPVCQEFGRIGSLELRQINAREAVYVCSNSQCCYPVGFTVEVVQRVIPELVPEFYHEHSTNNGLEHAPQQLTVSSPSGGQVPPHSQSTNLLPASVPPPSQPTNPSSVHVPDVQIYIDHELDALLNSLLDDET